MVSQMRGDHNIGQILDRMDAKDKTEGFYKSINSICEGFENSQLLSHRVRCEVHPSDRFPKSNIMWGCGHIFTADQAANPKPIYVMPSRQEAAFDHIGTTNYAWFMCSWCFGKYSSLNTKLIAEMQQWSPKCSLCLAEEIARLTLRNPELVKDLSKK